MRELVLDTETTGLDVSNGDRIVEIGIIELVNHVQTGKFFHRYLNPERDSDIKAQKIHGLSREFLNDKPKFSEIVDEFVSFISDSKIIIHNASFDVGFINSELRRCYRAELKEDTIIDTLMLAKKRFIGQSVSLDSLCKKFKLDISHREIHGAIKDAKLLAQVYLELIGGKQTNMNFNGEDNKINSDSDFQVVSIENLYEKNEKRAQKNTTLNNSDYKLHKKSIKEITDSIWDKLRH